MNNLTAERCKKLISQLIFERDNGGMSNQKFDYLEALEIALPVLEQQGGWISCSERMPERGIDVLACRLSNFGGYEEIETAQWHGGMKSEQPVFITSADTIEPSHWQPLPVPPPTDTYRQIENDGREG